METIGVVATSGVPSAVSISDEESDTQLQSRNRGAAWSDYEGL